MITVGEITRVYTDVNNTVICDVDISMFRSTLNNFDTSNKLNGSIFTATICTPPGLYMPYDVGDVVYVSFINDEISTPVILGLVHKNLPKEGDSSSYAYFKDLSVTNNAKLPENTTIGDITFNKLKSDILTLNNNATVLEQLRPTYKHVLTFEQNQCDWRVIIYSKKSTSYTLNISWDSNDLIYALYNGDAIFVSGSFEGSTLYHLFDFSADENDNIHILYAILENSGTLYAAEFSNATISSFNDSVSLL